MGRSQTEDGGDSAVSEVGRAGHLSGGLLPPWLELHSVLGSRIQSSGPKEPANTWLFPGPQIGGSAGLDLSTRGHRCCGLEQDPRGSGTSFRSGCSH